MNIRKMTLNAMSLASLAVFACCICAFGAEKGEHPQSLKVLMIGNSFSASVLREFPAVAKNAGVTLDLASLFIGGCSLELHWANVEKADDPRFKPYNLNWNYGSEQNAKAGPLSKYGKNINIPAALTADKWDIVTIQQASGKSLFFETYEPYAGKLIAKIRELAPQAEIVIQQTWSYSPYDSRLKTWKMTPAVMHATLKKAYSQLADKYKFRVIPTGDAVQNYRAMKPVEYKKILTKAEIKALQEPEVINFYGDVTGRSNWSKGQKGKKDAEIYRLRSDTSHLNVKGHFLQALVWQATLFGTDVTKLEYVSPNVTADEAAVMRRAVAAAIRQQANRR